MFLNSATLESKCFLTFIVGWWALTSWDCRLLALYSCRMMTSHSCSVGGRGGWEALLWIRRGCKEVMSPPFTSGPWSCLAVPRVSLLSPVLLPSGQRDMISDKWYQLIKVALLPHSNQFIDLFCTTRPNAQYICRLWTKLGPDRYRIFGAKADTDIRVQHKSDISADNIS